MVQYGAIRLFVQSARRTLPGFELTSADGVEVAHICRLVQGLPLGILLAAAWVGTITPAEITYELEQSLDFLEADGCDVPERQRSLRAVFDYAWRLLTAREQTVLQALSVFRGGCTREAAQQVIGASLHELKALVAKSLLQHTSSGRYEIHQLVWQYVAEKLDRALSSAERASLYDRHSAYYVAALQLSAADFSGPRQQAALAAVEADSENIRAAWYWAVEQGQVERLEQAMEGLELFYWSSGRYHEGEAAFRAAAEKLATHESAARVLVRALAWQSNFRRLLGQRDSAHQLLQQCMALLARPEWVGQDTRSERALVFWLMGHTVFGSDRDRARQWYEQSLALYREIDRVGTANALRDLGRAAIFLGAFREARLRLEESLAIRQELDDPRGIADAMADLAEVALLQGQFEESELVARESCTRSQELGHRAAAAYSMLVYGETLEAAGEFAEAQAPLEECLTVYEDLGHHDYIAYVHAALGSVALHLGEYEHAHAHAQTSLALARQHGLRYRQGFPLLVSGCVALTAGACVEARQLLHESVAVYREIGQPHDVGWALAVLGYAVRELGDQRPAQHHLAEALQLAVATQAVAPLAWALPAMALLLADQGAPVRAVELYALASRHPLVARSRWFEDVAGGRMSALANTLPASMVVTAQERGQGRNLDAVVQELIAELAAIQ